MELFGTSKNTRNDLVGPLRILRLRRFRGDTRALEWVKLGVEISVIVGKRLAGGREYEIWAASMAVALEVGIRKAGKKVKVGLLSWSKASYRRRF